MKGALYMKRAENFERKLEYSKSPYLVKKQDRPIDWVVTVPGSKSMTNRALLMAALSDGTAEISGVLFSDDSRHFLECLLSLGVEVDIREKERKVRIAGCGGQIPAKEAVINVGSAGTAARFLTAMLGFSDGTYTIEASEQMKKRPMKPLLDLLEQAGAQICYLEKEGFLPISIRGCACERQRETQDVLREEPKEQQENEGMGQSPICLELDISRSTQFLSALLLISPMIKQGLRIHITSEKTDGSYIRITRAMMQEAGVEVAFNGRDYEVPGEATVQTIGVSEREKNRPTYHISSYKVEPDMSAACYFYAAAAVTGGRALVQNVYFNNTQGDLKFLTVLEQMGCTVTEEPEGIAVIGPADGRLKGITVDMNDFSDQALTLAAIAPFADSKVEIKNIAHIRQQESDRIHAITAELSKLGIRCEEKPDGVTIYPGMPTAGMVETYEDHRVAMAFSLLGLRADGIQILNPGCCGKTFENYFELLDELTER